MFALTMFGYAGQSIPIARGCECELRSVAAALLWDLRKDGHIIRVRSRGREWESLERENALTVSDFSGFLCLGPFIPPRPLFVNVMCP